MKKEYADKWVSALRSGAFPQARRSLHTTSGYCCLGVLCEIAGVQWKRRSDLTVAGDTFVTEGNEEWSYLPKTVMETTGVSTRKGQFRGVIEFRGRRELHIDLTILNDTEKADFKEIAEVIEKYWEIL